MNGWIQSKVACWLRKCTEIWQSCTQFNSKDQEGSVTQVRQTYGGMGGEKIASNSLRKLIWVIWLDSLPYLHHWNEVGGRGVWGGLRVSNKLDSTTWPVQGEPWVSEPDKHTLLGYSVVSLQPHTAAKSRSNNLHSPPVARVKPRPPWKWHKTGILPFYQQLWGTSACWSLGSACAHLFLSWL